MEGVEILRVVLAVDVAGMLVLALFYLRRRKLSRREQFLWGLVALFPVLGPFLVVASRPGAAPAPPRRAPRRRVFAADSRKRP